ncbi:MAG: hypothetical protein A2189_01815 [Paenibacillus sp. RIFOXYA1_FULL_44_5]|nr:MAG: hypothetical protein A2189_01815 [Paenibacillus sp. RIFOXYA1_FULL_44_5]
MIFSVQKFLERIKFIALFILFTCLIYVFLHIVSELIRPVDRYKEPEGYSLKVFQHHDTPQANSLLDRLIFFYWYGE